MQNHTALIEWLLQYRTQLEKLSVPEPTPDVVARAVDVVEVVEDKFEKMRRKFVELFETEDVFDKTKSKIPGKLPKSVASEFKEVDAGDVPNPFVSLITEIKVNLSSALLYIFLFLYYFTFVFFASKIV